MNLMQAVKMAWKSIMGKKGRSALTILGIFIGIAAVMTIVSVMEGMKQATLKQFAAMGANRITVELWGNMYDDKGNDLSPDYYPDLAAFCSGMPAIQGVTPQANASLTVSYGTKTSANMEWNWDDNGNLIGEPPPSFYYGSDQYSMCNNLIIANGRDISALDLKKYNKVCTVGAKAAKVFFGSTNPVGKDIHVNGQIFRVVGVYASRVEDTGGSASTTDLFFLFPYTARRTLGGDKPRSFVVKVRTAEEMENTVTRLRVFCKGLVGKSGGSTVYSEDQWAESSNSYMNLIGGVLAGIAAISLLVGGIGIMNIMLVTVTERTREIGIRRAIGAQRSSIVAQFLIEAAMLCGIGGIVGIAVGTVGSLILSQALLKMTIYPSPIVTMEAFSLSVGLGVLFGSYPAAKAARLQPVEALRAE